MVDTIIFDIGRVLIGYDWDELLMQLFDNDKVIIERLKNALFYHNIWDESDRGIWSEEKIINAFIEIEPDLADEILLFWNHAGEALEQYPFTKEWLKELKERGYRLLFLSNWSFHMKEQAKKQLDFMPLMDGGIYSCDVGMIKPDESIYRELIRKYDLNPAHCVFLDDRKENTDAAEKIGFNIIHVTSHEAAIEGLKRIL